MINQVLVGRALRLLAVQRHERVIDWFCGLGNFTLAAGDPGGGGAGCRRQRRRWCDRAQDNARSNAAQRARGPATGAGAVSSTRNLFEMTAQTLMADGAAHKWLMDPPREGAYALVQALGAGPSRTAARGRRRAAAGRSTWPTLPAVPADWTMPERIVYVSCNPATLARDAAVLVQQAGYRCVGAGVVNMFAAHGARGEHRGIRADDCRPIPAAIDCAWRGHWAATEHLSGWRPSWPRCCRSS